jgi:hypothetical protein
LERERRRSARILRLVVGDQIQQPPRPDPLKRTPRRSRTSPEFHGKTSTISLNAWGQIEHRL